MAVKFARVVAASAALGGPSFLSSEEADRIGTGPEEEYRRRLLQTLSASADDGGR